MNQSSIVVSKLLEHYHKQFTLAIVYDQLASFVNDKGYTFLSKYIYELSNDKIHTHREMLIEHFEKAGIIITGAPKIKNIDFNNELSVLDIAKYILKNEKDVRDEINNLASVCINEQDYEDFVFLQWYIADGLKDFGEIDQIVKILSNSSNPINEDLAISKYLNISSK